MKRKIHILILSVIVFFASFLFLSVNFQVENITIYQIIYISLFTVIVFSHSFIITRIDPALQKLIKSRFFLFLSRLITFSIVGVFICLFEYLTKLILLHEVKFLGLLMMLIPTITVFVGISLGDMRKG